MTTPIQYEGFNPVFFASIMALLSVVFLPLAALFIHALRKSHTREQSRKGLLGSLLSFGVGLFPPACWLSWKEGRGWEEFSRFGAPINPAPFQLVGCALTIAVLACLVMWKFSPGMLSLALFPLFTGYGSAAAVTLGVSFGDANMQGVASVFAFVGVALAVFFVDLPIFGFQFRAFLRGPVEGPEIPPNQQGTRNHRSSQDPDHLG